MKIVSVIFIFLLSMPFLSVAGDVKVGNDGKTTKSQEVSKYKDKTSHENSNDEDDYPSEGENDNDE